MTSSHDTPPNISQLRKDAARGNAAAQFDLGVCYDQGQGVEQDYQKAFELFKKAALKNIPEAEFNLGLCYIKGQGVEQNYQEAFKWFQKAALKGDANAQFNLGGFYYNGQGVEQNYQEAVKWFQKAAEQGHANAQSTLGCCYRNGKGVEQSDQKAFEWFQKAAMKDHVHAQYFLGVCYRNGKGVEQNYQEAVKWYIKAAEQDNADAQATLGFYYWSGECIEQDYKKAVEWFQKAARQGDTSAQCNLGLCYQDGQGVEQNYQEAIKWFQKAADQGIVEAKGALANALNKNKTISLSQKIQNLFKSIKYSYNFQQDAQKMAEQNQPRIQLRLNTLYYEIIKKIPILKYVFQKNEIFDNLYQAAANFVAGHFARFVRCDPAINTLIEQAEQNISPAQVVLFYLYQRGNGVEKNIETAKNYLLKAVENNDLLACYVLGKGYLEGEWIELDYDKSKFYLEKVNHQLKQEGIFSHFSDQKTLSDILQKEPPQKNDKIGYSREIKQWIGLLVQTHLTLLQERENQAELENTMALFAHKFRGSLRNIRYYIEKQPSSAKALQSIQIMDSLFDVFSWLSGDVKILHQKLQQDQQGKNSLLEVLNQSLIAVISQVLPQDKMDLIRQYYFQVALQQKHIPQSAKINELEEQYLDEWEHLQHDWEQNWLVLLENPHLDALKTWLAEHFFPIEIIGFEHTPIYFAQYGAKNSLFFIFMTELFLNAVKYYHSAEKQPVQFIWHKPHNDFYCFECTNPAFSDNAQTKGSHKGHSFLNLIANKLKGKFKISFNNQQYSGKLYLPKHYFNGASK